MRTFDYIFIIGVLLVVFGRMRQTLFNKNKSPGIKKEGWTFPTAVIAYNSIIVGTVVEYIILTREINYKVSIIGFFLEGFGLFLTLSSIKSLGRLWSFAFEIKEDHKIVKDGVYRYVRHPYYVGVLLEITGFSLFANSYYMLTLALLVLYPIIILRMILEEKLMTSVFREEYENYKREIRAFFPITRRNKCE